MALTINAADISDNLTVRRENQIFSDFTVQ